jgi:hypothetical protein
MCVNMYYFKLYRKFTPLDALFQVKKHLNVVSYDFPQLREGFWTTSAAAPFWYYLQFRMVNKTRLFWSELFQIEGKAVSTEKFLRINVCRILRQITKYVNLSCSLFLTYETNERLFNPFTCHCLIHCNQPQFTAR